MQAEKQKKEQEIFYKHLFDNNLGGIVLFDSKNLKNINCNGRVLEIFRCSRDQFLNEDISINQPLFQPDGIKTSI